MVILLPQKTPKMKPRQKKTPQKLLSDKIADALTVKPRADIEDDQVFGTKPETVTRDDLGSSDSDVEAAISDFRKRNVGLLSEFSKKYEGEVASRKNIEDSGEDVSDSENDLSDEKQPEKRKQNMSLDSDGSESENEPSTTKDTEAKPGDDDSEDFSDAESEDYSITQFQKQLNDDSESNESSNDDEEGSDDDEGEGYDISQMEEPLKEKFEHVKKQNVSEDAKKGISIRNQLLLWEGLLEMRIHLQRCVNTANQMPLPDTYSNLKENEDFLEETNATKANVTNVLDK